MNRSALLPLLLPLLAWSCGGQDTFPSLYWGSSTATVSSTGTVSATLDFVAGTVPMPRDPISVCLFAAGGAPAAPAPAGHCSLASPPVPGCVIPPGAAPFCSPPTDCSQGCTFTFDFTGANAGGGTGALAGTWYWVARGPTPVQPSGPIAVTQTVP